MYSIYKADSRKMYEIFVEIVSKDTHYRYEMNSTIDYQISTEKCKSIFTLAFLYTVNKKVCEFQCKLM